MKKINEIFYSLQGEGYHTGTAAVFVRFSGCNLVCSFCDTHHQESISMSDEEIVREVSQYPARHVVLTGGEPGIHVTSELVRLLKQAGKYIQIETNGTQILPDWIDWITCSPKEGGEVVLKKVDELKIVYTGQNLSLYNKITARHHFLQPCSGQNTEEVVEYIKAHPKWRLSLQTHKLIHIP